MASTAGEVGASQKEAEQVAPATKIEETKTATVEDVDDVPDPDEDDLDDLDGKIWPAHTTSRDLS